MIGLGLVPSLGPVAELAGLVVLVRDHLEHGGFVACVAACVAVAFVIAPAR